MNKFHIKGKNIGEKSLYFVIEEGMAYWGNVEKAHKMIDAAKSAGADAIEFQLYDTDDFIIKKAPNYELLKSIQLSENNISELIKHTKEVEIDFIAAVSSPSLIEKLVKFNCEAFNIKAADINNPEIIDEISNTGFPFFLSTFLSTEKEIDWAYNRILKRGKATPNMGFLHGQHNMFNEEGGLKVVETSLGILDLLKQKYKHPVGYTDHTPYLFMPSIATAAGADFITKHLALSRSEKGPDWHICLEPEEMKESIVMAKDTKSSILIKQITLTSTEEKDVPIMRKSIISSRKIKAGTVLSLQDLCIKRPGTGISPDYLEEIIGKKVIRDIDEEELFTFKDIE